MDEATFAAVMRLVDNDAVDPLMRTSGGVALTLIREALDARKGMPAAAAVQGPPEPQPGDEVLVVWPGSSTGTGFRPGKLEGYSRTGKARVRLYHVTPKGKVTSFLGSIRSVEPHKVQTA